MTRQAKRQLFDAGRRRQAADRAVEAASQSLTEAVEKAAAEGIPKTEIAKLAGVSRQTIYDILERQGH
jgi:DNA invertase Pin-like site-specific DNA recombinase